MFYKKLFFFSFIFFLIAQVSAQTVPVTLHYEPVYNEFTTLRLVGTFNGWNNADPEMVMTDLDRDGVYEITVDLATGTQHMYKFVMDADWGLAWSDPDNPEINLTDNDNSVLNPNDPMITYLLPRDVNSAVEMYVDTTKAGKPIRAIFAFTESNAIDVNTLSVTIDGNEVTSPSQYYDSNKKEFNYQPEEPLSAGEHTVVVSVSSPSGNISKSSTFRREPGLKIYKVPTDFYYDANNSIISFTQDVQAVSVVGTFNNWNDQFNPMTDEDGDGVWETTVELEEGDYEYKFKLNGFFWVNDPDSKMWDDNGDNNLITVIADTIPSIKLITPNEGKVFETLPEDSSPPQFDFAALLRPGAKSLGVDEATITFKVNDLDYPFTYSVDSSIVKADISLPNPGQHFVTLSFKNQEGLTSTETYTYGFFSSETGVYFVDALKDEIYKYPSGTPSGSADILNLYIDETESHDSLEFTIELRDISDRTRLGLLISNPDESFTAHDPFSLDILMQEWNNEGVFASIGIPGNSFMNLEKENRFIESRVPLVYGNELIEVDSTLLDENILKFKVSLFYLDSLLTGWTRERSFYLFSFLAASDMSGNGMELFPGENGSTFTEDPDVYDVMFIRDGFWQEKLLKSYIVPGAQNGPRLVSLDGPGRGLVTLTASDISDSLATYGPVITFLTPPADYWYSDLTVYGQLSDAAISEATFYLNGEETVVTVTNGFFEVPVTLVEGKNIVLVKAVDAKGFESTSRELVLNYTVDHTPYVSISGSVDGRNITLTADGSSPDNLPLTYFWTKDRNNPANLIFSNTAQTINFEIPDNADGEYYLNARVADSESRLFRARVLITASGDSVSIASINDHASWIDKAILYEIYPRAFSEQGGFLGIQNRIPDMVDLGINTVWLMPIYKGPTTHGYEITNYYDFEEDYGTEENFISMMDAFKDANIKVILDYVVNHTSVQHPFMQNVFEYKEYSPWSDFYIWSGEPGNSNFEFFFDWASLPNLNHNNPDVREYFINVAKYWVSEYDVDGFRCDVAWGVQERNSQFWIDWRKELKNIKPEVLLQAEASSADEVYYQQRFDSANDWELRNRLIEAINGTNTIAALHGEVLRNYPSYARPLRFVENHDEVRIASSHDIERSKLAHTILFTLNGVPLIYSGAEVGETTQRDKIDWNGSESVREYFKKLINLRKKFIKNPKIQLIPNNKLADVYSYASVSGNDQVFTIANFRDSQKDITLNFRNFVSDTTISYYLTDLISGSTDEVKNTEFENFNLSLNSFDARVFYFGTDSVTLDVSNNNIAIVEDYQLYQNYPNPFNPSTTIKFDLVQPEKVTLKIFDILGREIKTLVNEELNKGQHSVHFNAGNISSGIYFYRIETKNFVDTKKLLLLK